jgi:hypothetical protein
MNNMGMRLLIEIDLSSIDAQAQIEAAIKHLQLLSSKTTQTTPADASVIVRWSSYKSQFDAGKRMPLASAIRILRDVAERIFIGGTSLASLKQLINSGMFVARTAAEANIFRDMLKDHLDFVD